MPVYSLIIINKAGGLIYQREFQPGLRKLSTNDYLVLAGTFHGCLRKRSVHAITRSITPKIPNLAFPNSAAAPTTSTTPATPSTPQTAATAAAAATSNTSTPAPTATATATATSNLASSRLESASSSTSTYPNPSAPITGLETLETEKFRLTCFQTLTGTKFLLFTDPAMADIEGIMKTVYELYADYVMKNPFYQIEMPVRCEGFERHLGGYLRGRA
ncbi:trafficking protein particle complex subunit 4 [Aspergillus lucknowensis]|uniref:Trafficking protein particle complex subunit n=1 Tax=Aspergillus lucknowensis TaxID=176173 RepID=A0ABR4L8R5_9EURO